MSRQILYMFVFTLHELREDATLDLGITLANVDLFSKFLK